MGCLLLQTIAVRPYQSVLASTFRSLIVDGGVRQTHLVFLEVLTFAQIKRVSPSML